MKKRVDDFSMAMHYNSATNRALGTISWLGVHADKQKQKKKKILTYKRGAAWVLLLSWQANKKSSPTCTSRSTNGVLKSKFPPFRHKFDNYLGSPKVPGVPTNPLIFFPWVLQHLEHPGSGGSKGGGGGGQQARAPLKLDQLWFFFTPIFGSDCTREH